MSIADGLAAILRQERPKPPNLEEIISGLAGRRADAEAALADAEASYGRAALDFERGVPGAADRKADAAAARRTAHERVNEVLSLQIAADAERRDTERHAREQEQEQSDANVLATGATYESTAAEFQAAAEVLVGKLWPKLQDAHRDHFFALRANPVTSEKWWLEALGGLVELELCRVARIVPGDRLHTADALPGMRRVQGANIAEPMLAQVRRGQAGVRDLLQQAAHLRKKKARRK